MPDAPGPDAKLPTRRRSRVGRSAALPGPLVPPFVAARHRRPVDVTIGERRVTRRVTAPTRHPPAHPVAPSPVVDDRAPHRHGTPAPASVATTRQLPMRRPPSGEP